MHRLSSCVSHAQVNLGGGDFAVVRGPEWGPAIANKPEQGVAITAGGSFFFKLPMDDAYKSLRHCQSYNTHGAGVCARQIAGGAGGESSSGGGGEISHNS